MENLKHFYEEETILMAELHKFYTDEELKNIDRQTYQQMTPEHMIAMLKTLSPHMDASDKEFFLAIIKETEPEKFKAIENQIN